MNSQRHPLQQYWDLYGAAIKAKALDIALEKELFDYLEDYLPVTMIAEKAAVDPGMAEAWLTLLWSMNCLERKKIQDNIFMYKRSELAATYLCPSSEACCVDSLRFRHHSLQQFALSLESGLTVSANGPVTSVAPQAAWANAAEKQIKQEQKNASSRVLQALLSELPFSEKPSDCLDIGGGAGYMLKTIADHFPQTRATLFDFPATIEVAKANLRGSPCYERLEFIGGDISQNMIPGRYDFILCASVFHFIKDLPALIQNMWGILKPGGMILVLHSEITDSKQETGQVLPFYLPMKLRHLYVPEQGEIVSRFMAMPQSHHVMTRLLTDSPIAPLRAHVFLKNS